MKWTKETALKELESLIGEIPGLKGQRRLSADHTRWGIGVLQLLEQVFGPNSRFYVTFAGIQWHDTGSFIIQGIHDLQGAIERRHQDAYVQHLDSARGVLLAARDELARSNLDEVYEGKDTGPESSGIMKLISLVEQRLRRVVRSSPVREKDIQDALENLLVGADLSYSRETDAIEYSSKTYTPDFTLRRLDLALEVKLCSTPGREKELIAEINDDILAYRTKYGNILFVVYDVGLIRDVERFVTSFEASDSVLVRVIKH